jgi:formyltetrahydrofolate hydrolase
MSLAKNTATNAHALNKLLFNYERNFNYPITLVANNHKDLEDYLKTNYDFYVVIVKDDQASIVECPGDCTEYVDLIWIKQI